MLHALRFLEQVRVRALAPALIMTLAAGDCPDEKTPVDVDPDPEVSIDSASLTFEALGQSSTLTATVTNASGNVTIDWTSADSGVASVDDSGVVTSEGVGTTRIRATVENSWDEASVTVTQAAAALQAYPLPRRGEVGTVLPDSIVVTLLDAGQNAIPGEMIAFTPTAGSASPEQVETDASGRAASAWTLDTIATATSAPDTMHVVAVTDSTLSAAFVATVEAGAPVLIDKLFGDGETWIRGDSSGAEVVARVVDRYGNGVPDQWLNYTARNGGWTQPDTTTTDEEGVASVEWFMGNWDRNPYSPMVQPDTLEVSAGSVDPVVFVGKVNVNRTTDTSEGDKRELTVERLWYMSVVHTCPDSNTVLITPAGVSTKAARIDSVAGEDCANPRLFSRGEPGFPPEYPLYYEMPDFGLTGQHTWHYEYVVRGVSTGRQVGNNRICPQVDCRFYGDFSSSPQSVPRDSISSTEVTLTSYVENPDGGPVSVQWTLPLGTTLVGGTNTTDEEIRVIFPVADAFRVRISVINSGGKRSVVERVIPTHLPFG